MLLRAAAIFIGIVIVIFIMFASIVKYALLIFIAYKMYISCSTTFFFFTFVQSPLSMSMSLSSPFQSRVPHSINYVAKLPKEIEAHIILLNKLLLCCDNLSFRS